MSFTENFRLGHSEFDSKFGGSNFDPNFEIGS